MRHLIDPLERRTMFATGQLDTTFGTSGHTDLTVANAEFDFAPVDIDGAETGQVIVTAATLLPTDLENELGSVYIWRLRPDGSVDTSFGDDGLVTLLGAGYGPDSVTTVIAPDSGFFVKINNLIYKLKNNGTRDKSFGTNGRIDLVDHTHDFAVTSDGKIYSVHGTFDGLKIRRRNSDGSIDTSYGTAGTFTPPGGIRPRDFRIQVLNDGSIGVGGMALPSGAQIPSTTPSFDAAAVKLKSDGTLDTSFDDDGFAIEQAFNNDLTSITGFSPVITADGVLVYSTQRTPADPGSGPATRSVTAIDFKERGGVPIGGLLSADDAIGDGGSGERFFVIQDAKLIFAGGSNSSAANESADDAIGDDYSPGRLAFQSDGSILVASLKGDVSGPGFPLQSDAIGVHRIFRDDAPVALVNARTLTQQRNGSYRFVVQYRDDDNVDISTLGNDDVTVRMPDGTRRRARLVSTDVTADAKVVNVAYLVTSPDGVWNADDNGKYAIRLERLSVRDTSGNAAAQRQIGVFFVQIPQVVVVPFGDIKPADLAEKETDDLLA